MAQDPSEIDPVDPELDLEDEPGDPAGEPDSSEDAADDSSLDAGTAAEPERQPSRRDGRIQRLVEDSRRRDAENADLRRRLDELTARASQPAQQPQQQQETDAERAARFEMMSPGQAMVEALKEAEAKFERRMNFATAQTADSVDRTSFQARAAREPRVAKWLPKVEARLAELRQQGINMNRDVLYKFMLGEAMDQHSSSPEASRQSAEARQRVQQRSRRVADTGSDLAPSREQRRSGGDEAAARERRLSNQLI